MGSPREPRRTDRVVVGCACPRPHSLAYIEGASDHRGPRIRHQPVEVWAAWQASARRRRSGWNRWTIGVRRKSGHRRSPAMGRSCSAALTVAKSASRTRAFRVGTPRWSSVKDGGSSSIMVAGTEPTSTEFGSIRNSRPSQHRATSSASGRTRSGSCSAAPARRRSPRPSGSSPPTRLSSVSRTVKWGRSRSGVSRCSSTAPWRSTRRSTRRRLARRSSRPRWRARGFRGPR